MSRSHERRGSVQDSGSFICLRVALRSVATQLRTLASYLDGLMPDTDGDEQINRLTRAGFRDTFDKRDAARKIAGKIERRKVR